MERSRTALEWEQVIVAAADPQALVRWRAETLGWEAVDDGFESLGARRVDIGQGDQPWVVLADPEGNEFCVLQARRR